MTLRLLGNRVMVKPIDEADPSDALVLTDAYEPIADVVLVGQPHCLDCDGPRVRRIDPGMRVILRPYAPYQEVREAGQLLGWILDLDDVLAEVTEEAHA